MSRLRSTAPRAVAATSLLALLAPTAALAQPARDQAPVHHPAQTRVLADCVHRAVEPRRLIGACGDVNEYAVVAHYRYWHDDFAVGRGTLHLNDCHPTCAAGESHAYPARFYFHDVKRTGRGPLFAKVDVSYVQAGTLRSTVMFLPTRPI